MVGHPAITLFWRPAMDECFPESAAEPERPSKSARKRAMHQLQDLGTALVDLNAQTLTRLPLSDALRTALAEARRISSRGALRRQLQYIGRLMRDEDAEAIRLALERLPARSRPASAPED